MSKKKEAGGNPMDETYEIKLVDDGEKIPLEDCVLSDRWKYKGRTIQIGIEEKKKLMIIYVDGIWLTCVRASDLFPFEDHKHDKAVKLGRKLLSVAMGIIDKAVEEENKK
jgi:hypothetical protein